MSGSKGYSGPRKHQPEEAGMKCAVCHEPIVWGFASDPSCHPNHTDAELAPTRRRVERLANVWTLVILALMATEVVES